MKLKLYYQYTTKKNLSANDYFKDILSNIEPEYPHKATESKTIFIPVDYDDLENIESQGLLTIDREINNILHPHYVVKELIVTFAGLEEDYKEVVEHLVEKFGVDATYYQIEKRLNDPK